MTPAAPRRGEILAAIAAVVLSASVAAAARLAGSALSRPAPRRPPAGRARCVPRPPPNRWGGPLVAAPLVSRGRPVASHPRGGDVLVDGVYRTRATWAGGHPSAAQPSWAAIDVGTGPTRLLVSWTSSGNHDYFDLRYGAPVDYRIETSADSTDGADGRWETAVEVTGNPVRTRAHAVDFAGRRWVRLVVTRLSPDVTRWGLQLDEIDVHDLSCGGDDVWLFVGDSITSGVLDRAPAHQPSFPEAVAARHPGHFPAAVAAGKGRLHHADALRLVDDALALNPDARVVALSFGSNDWDPVAFRADLVAVVHRVRAAGKIPIVPRIPYRSDAPADFPGRLDRVVDEVTAELGLLPGPDLHAFFAAHPERLADGLHPDDEGAVQLIRLWADAVAPLYAP